MNNTPYKPLVYLACPYKDDDPEVMRERFNTVTRVAGHFMAQGLTIYSPITHCHPIAQATDLPRSWDYWEKIDRAYLTCSHALYALCLPGWDKSEGVTAEIAIARELGIEIHFVSLHDDKITVARAA